MVRLDWRQRYALELWAVENLHQPSAEPPENWPAASRLRTNGVVPIFCGEYAPGLTGLYAIVNGLRLLVADASPLKPSDEQMLLEVGCTFMSGREALVPTRGLRADLLIRMAEAMAFSLSRRRGIWIRCERLETEVMRRAMMPLFERSVVAKRVVLILLGRGHYSVLRGYTRDSWLLFDATGREWLLRRGKRGNSRPLPILMLSR